jgi:2-oxoglutarate ferredoxin oxidoreductase subunit alpha
MDGDHAACEGAIAAGCRFAAGYPITPSTEIVERFSQRIPLVGGLFVQMEDEIASSIAIQGAAWAGKKVMTVTSGPGFSLMMEHVGYAVMTETPLVIVDVQRAGPSTGLPTLPAQGDMMQVKWGSHGDYQPIALCPNSPQECFDVMIKAFNLAEEYRTPVFVMMDEVVGHMTERVVIPPAEEIEVTPRRFTSKRPGEYRMYDASEGLVPEMAKVGDGHNVHVTGLTHDERGYPAMAAAAHAKLVSRLSEKILSNADKLVDVEATDIDDAEVVVISYGITSRVVSPAIAAAKERGIKVGHVRLIIAWPFPARLVSELSQRVKAIVVPELNLGQMVHEAQRAATGGRAKVISVPHPGGTVHDPQVVLARILEAAQ